MSCCDQAASLAVRDASCGLASDIRRGNEEANQAIAADDTAPAGSARQARGLAEIDKLARKHVPVATQWETAHNAHARRPRAQVLAGQRRTAPGTAQRDTRPLVGRGCAEGRRTQAGRAGRRQALAGPKGGGAAGSGTAGGPGRWRTDLSEHARVALRRHGSPLHVLGESPQAAP